MNDTGGAYIYPPLSAAIIPEETIAGSQGFHNWSGCVEEEIVLLEPWWTIVPQFIQSTKSHQHLMIN